jgi:hypothetical protein
MSDSYEVDFQSVVNSLLDEKKRFLAILISFIRYRRRGLALLKQHWPGYPYGDDRLCWKTLWSLVRRIVCSALKRPAE